MASVDGLSATAARCIGIAGSRPGAHPQPDEVAFGFHVATVLVRLKLYVHCAL